MSGLANISYDGTNNPTVGFTGGSNSVTLTCSQPVTLTTAVKPFYIALPPTKNSSANYKVEIITFDQVVTKRMSDDAVNKIEVSKILTMPELTVTPSNATNLSSAGTANCYIAAPNGFYTIKVNTKGNSAAPGDAINPSSVKLLWNTGVSSDEVIGLLQDVTSEGTVNFTTNRAGNAVIAAFSGANGSGDILWSWHIWVTDYDPNSTSPLGYVTYPNSLPINNAIMMDRNLGALSARNDLANTDDFGLLYQWGRKDPFRGAEDRVYATVSLFAPTSVATGYSWDNELVENAVDANDIALDYAIKHPITFIKDERPDSDSPLRDWYCIDASHRNDALWSSTKSLYDPCPAGWRVPDGGPGVWNGFTDNLLINSGMTFNVPATWYPAAGQFKVDSSLEYVGNYGFIWSCSVYGENAYAFYFDFLGNVNLGNSYERANGLSVRCQKE